MERHPSGSGHQMMEHCAHKEMDGNKAGGGWAKAPAPDDWLCPENIVHTNSLGCCRRAARSRAFMLFTPDSERPHKCCARNCFANLPLSNFSVSPCEWRPQLAARSRQGAAPSVFYCCSGSTHSRSGTSVVTRGYISSLRLPVVSYQSVCSHPLTLTSPFPPNCCHWFTGYCRLLGTIFCKPWRFLCQFENPSRWASCRPAASLAPRSTRSDARFELQEGVFAMITIKKKKKMQQVAAMWWLCICYWAVGPTSHTVAGKYVCPYKLYINNRAVQTMMKWVCRWEGMRPLLPAANVCFKPCSPAAGFGFVWGFEKRIHLRVFFRISVKKLSNPALFSSQNKNTAFLFQGVFEKGLHLIYSPAILPSRFTLV